MTMKIGVIGSGDVGKTLAGGFHAHGHEVRIGTRDPARLGDWLAAHPGIAVGSFAEVAAFADAVVLAVGGEVAADALQLAGADNLAGKLVMDATNPIDTKRPPVNGVLHFFTTLDDSLMERLQRAFPQARFVKVFSSVGNALMIDPDFGDTRPSMFICGNDEAAKASVAGILEDFGWETKDMGKAEAARAIEPLCMLWCIPGLSRNEWTHAFKLLRKP